MVQIVCTQNLTTGGAELLHQFCGELQKQKVEASMLYYNRKESSYPSCEINDNYQKYISQKKSSEFQDAPGNIIVFPEVMAYLALKVKYAKVIIWWLSVDNYLINLNLDYYYCNGLDKTFSEFKKIGRRPSFSKLKNFNHIAQSEYALNFLKSKSITSKIVGDFISDDFISNIRKEQEKENIICYNPQKGLKVTESVIRCISQKYDNIKFIPLSGMTSEQIMNTFSKSKLYIDFGHHPGKDRMPREAALQKCIVITGKRGAAAYFNDLKISDKYKFNEHSETFLTNLSELIEDITANYEMHIIAQQPYFDSIVQEKRIFEKQVLEFISDYQLSCI